MNRLWRWAAIIMDRWAGALRVAAYKAERIANKARLKGTGSMSPRDD